jgi:hypothetical protein
MSSKKQATVTVSATVTDTVVQAPEFTIDNPLAELKTFVEAHQIPVVGHKGHKATYLNAISAYFAPQVEAVAEALEPIATNTVEPIAKTIEVAAVKAHTAVTSPQAINGYRGVLRGAIWMGVGLVLAIGLLYTLAVLAWDAIDGEPACVAWVKTYSKTPRGRRIRRELLAHWLRLLRDLSVVGAPLAARAKEVRAIVQGGAAKVFGA